MRVTSYKFFGVEELSFYEIRLTKATTQNQERQSHYHKFGTRISIKECFVLFVYLLACFILSSYNM